MMSRDIVAVAGTVILVLTSACTRSTPLSPEAAAVQAGSTALTAGGGAPAFSSMLLSAALPFGSVSNASGGAPASPSTLLYIKRGTCSPTPTPACQLKTPDGDGITSGEWNAIEGRLSAKCITEGTHIVVHISNAIPNGVYSLWLNGLALGPDDGSENAVRVSAAGEGQLSAIDPAGCAPTGSLLILAYHNDGQLHGPVPGGPTTWVGQLHSFLP
jgi:hypothetical protein